MDQQPIEGGHAGNESDDNADNKSLKWRYVFDWGFWSGHPLAIFTIAIGGLLLAPITSFPGGKPQSLWFVAAGILLILGSTLWWVFSGIIARLEGRELLTKQEIADRDQKYKDGIQSQLNVLKGDIGTAQNQLTELKPRRLTAAQKKAITEKMSKFSGQGTSVLCALADSESITYGTDFATALVDAGWKFQGYIGSTAPSRMDSVGVAVHPETEKERTMPIVAELLKALAELGLTNTSDVICYSTSIGKTDVSISIAVKPLAAPTETADSISPNSSK